MASDNASNDGSVEFSAETAKTAAEGCSDVHLHLNELATLLYPCDATTNNIDHDNDLATRTKRTVALKFIRGMTGTTEGVQIIASNRNIINVVISLAAANDETPKMLEMVNECLINLTADESIAAQLIAMPPHFLIDLIKRCVSDIQPNRLDHDRSPVSKNGNALDKSKMDNGTLIDTSCIILSNMSHVEASAFKIVRRLQHCDWCSKDEWLFRVVDCLVKHNDSRHHLASFLANVTQVCEVRHVLLDKEKCVMQRLVPFINYTASLVRRTGIVAAVRNCCFETDYHDWLLSETGVDLLPRLLLPLAGAEEFDEEDTNKLPVDLQYLPDDKQREPDAAIRRMLVESINQLCAKRQCRAIVHSRNAYVILREYHKWETVELNVTALENLISLLISDEPPPGMENLKEIEIPDHIQKTLNKNDNLLSEQDSVQKDVLLQE